VEEEKAEATFSNGVLTVTLPRAAEAPERRRRIAINGAGDCIAALFLVHYARERSAALALAKAAASVYGLLRRTAEAGSRESLTVEAQDEFVAPTATFAAEAV